MPSMYGKFTPERSNSGGGYKSSIRQREESAWNEEYLAEKTAVDAEQKNHDLNGAIWECSAEDNEGFACELYGTGIGYAELGGTDAYTPTKVTVAELLAESLNA